MSVITVQELEPETKLDLVPTLLLLASAGTKSQNISLTKVFFFSFHEGADSHSSGTSQ